MESQNTKKILVIDDEDELRKALFEKFEHEGFTVLQAKDGQEGLDLALAQHPDCILVDVVMPRMDGITMLKKLREDAWGKNANVIILTNLSNGERAEDALEAKARNYLIKTDWSISDLAEKVKQSLSATPTG